MKSSIEDTPDRPTDEKAEREHSAAYLESRMPDIFEGWQQNPGVRVGYILAIEALEGKA